MLNLLFVKNEVDCKYFDLRLKEIEMKIPILMNTDDNFISQLRTAIVSARKATPYNHILDVTILCNKELKKYSRDRIYNLKDMYKNLKISFYEVSPEDFVNTKSSNEHISEASYYRLIASNAIEEDKCLYIDGDLVVDTDLSELYDIDMGDNLIAGVADMNIIMHPNLTERYADACKIDSFEDYINCGVMILNLKKIREKEIIHKFLAEANEGCNWWLDQDVLNRVCHGQIKQIDWNYNFIPIYTEEQYGYFCGVLESETKGKIYHWAGPQKPWNNIDVSYAKKWWRIAEEAIEPEVYKEIYTIAEKEAQKKSLRRIAEICREEVVIVIIGYSDHGVHVFEKLRKEGIKSRILYGDNSIEKCKRHAVREKVLSVEKSVEHYLHGIL